MGVTTQVTQLRQGIVNALSTKLGTEDQQISGYVFRNPTPPTVWCRPKPDLPITYNVTLGSGGGAIQLWVFLIEAFCGDPLDRGAQERLDRYVSPGAYSIAEALTADVTFGGVCQNSKLVQCNAYVEYIRADGNPIIGANWQLELYPV